MSSYAQWVWYLNNNYLGVVYWTTNKFTDPATRQRDIMLRGRGEFSAAELKENAATYEVDDLIPEDLADGLSDYVIAQGYWERYAQKDETAWLIKARHFENEYKRKTQRLMQYFGKNRRASNPTINPFQLA